MADASGETGTRKSGLVDKVRDSATSQLNNQKNRATDGLGSVAQAVRQSTQQLRDQNHDVIARYTEQAADQIDRLSERIRDKDIDELLSDAQRLARSQPALFVGGAFALGLIGARFFKSSSREGQYSGQGGYGYRQYDSNDRADTGRVGASGGTATGGEYRGYSSGAGERSFGGSTASRVHDYQSSSTPIEEVGTPSPSSRSMSSESTPTDSTAKALQSGEAAPNTADVAGMNSTNIGGGSESSAGRNSSTSAGSPRRTTPSKRS